MKKHTALMLSVMLLTLSTTPSAQTVYEMLLNSDVRHARFLLSRDKICAKLAYTMYAQHGAQNGSQLAKDDVRFGSHSWHIGNYICTFIGMEEVRKIEIPTEPMVSAYKASACAIRKAEKIGIVNPMMTSSSLLVLEQDGSGSRKKRLSFDDFLKKDLFPMDLFRDLTLEIEKSECKLSFDEAHAIHRDHVKRHFFVNSNACLQYRSFRHALNAMPLTFQHAHPQRKDKGNGLCKKT